jgi:hypothetical protein
MYQGIDHAHKYDITAAQLDECIRQVSAGWHPTIMDACCQNRYIYNLLQEVGCTERYLWNAMLLHDTTFAKRGLLCPRQEFTPKQLTKRVNYCERMLKLPAEEMKKIFWIDQKLVYLVSSHYGVHRWCQRRGATGQASNEIIVESPMMDKKYKTWRLYLYLVVNAHLGTYKLYLMDSGTHGTGASTTPYKVRPSRSTTTLL